MPIELCCPGCPYHFRTSLTDGLAEILERLKEEGPWGALGDGETYEDALHAALTTWGRLHCPHCGTLVGVSESTLGRLTQEVLANW